MPSSHDELRETIQRLHDELTSAEDIDAGMADELRAAVADIQTALSRRVEPVPADTSADEEDKAPTPAPHDRLSDAARSFEGSHPVLARTIGQLVDILGQMGI